MTDGSWKQFDLVPEEYEVREGQPDYTGRICVIGTDLKEDDLLKLFHVQDTNNWLHIIMESFFPTI